ncbi:MAG: mechanosensitive ion channel [Gammaproteobacteria bacterium]|nr:mechanosensitive ion channel [Gammaproteobacteria bacterium]
MNESVFTFEALTAVFQNMLAETILYMPRIAAAVLLLLVGWLLARLLSFLVVRTIRKLDVLWQRLVLKRGIEYLQPNHPPTRIVGQLVFWLLMLVFVTLATEILGLGIFGTWLKKTVTYLPLAVAGLLIMLVGFVVSSLVRDLVASAAESAGLSHGDLLSRTAQISILLFAIILGIDQIGIDIMFLSIIAGIVLAAMLGGIALAFGLGARTHVSNIIAANQLRQIYQIGDKVRVGDIEGRLMNIMMSRVIIETESGTVDMPAKIFDEQVTIIIEKGS